MDKFEKYISEHADEFDFYEPSPEVWTKIQKNSPKGKIINPKWLSITYKVAAGIAIFILSYYFHDFVQNYNSKHLAEQNSTNQEIIIPEVQEAENFYNTEANNKLQEVAKFTANNPEINQLLKTDIAELDSICRELKKDLKDNADNEEVVNALIQNYRLKVQILEEILNHLKKENNTTTKTKNNEYQL